MRFTRHPKLHLKKPSKRRSAAARRALQQHCDRAPLFADQIAEEQVTPDEPDEDILEYWRQMRNEIAANWRRARRTLAELPSHQAADIRIEWRYRDSYGNPESLLDLIHRRLRGEAISPTYRAILLRQEAWRKQRIARQGPPPQPSRRTATPETAGSAGIDLASTPSNQVTPRESACLEARGNVR